jgi:hypothetical protein
MQPEELGLAGFFVSLAYPHGAMRLLLGYQDRVTDNRFQYANSDAALHRYSPKAGTVTGASPSTDTLPDDDREQDQHEGYPRTVANVVRLHDLADHKIYNT